MLLVQQREVWKDGENDASVMKAYGFTKDASESEVVAKLFKLYQELTRQTHETSDIQIDDGTGWRISRCSENESTGMVS